MAAAPSLASQLRTPSAALSTPVSQTPSIGAHRHPAGRPSWQGSGGPASRHSACSSDCSSQAPQVSPSPYSLSAPLLWALSSAPGPGDASAGSPQPPARREDPHGAPDGWAAARAQEHPGCAPSRRPPPPRQKPARSPPHGAHRPTPTNPKKEKNTPNETLQLSQQQAEALLPTQMWGSFQDPSSREFLGGTGRKPPTFHADRRLQTVCCSCNEILIFPPFFSFSHSSFFFPLWCV